MYETSQENRMIAFRTLCKHLKQQKRSSDLRKFRKAYTLILNLGGLRELPKFTLIRVLDVFRRELLHCGTAFVARGRLDSPEAVFGLRICDIDLAECSPGLDLRQLCEQRGMLWNSWNRISRTGSLELPRLINTRGTIIR